MSAGQAWNVETLAAAVEQIAGEHSAAVSWADAAGAAVSRRRGRRPPQLAVGVCIRDSDAERRIRALPGFVRLSAREETDLDGDPVRVLRAVFARLG